MELSHGVQLFQAGASLLLGGLLGLYYDLLRLPRLLLPGLISALVWDLLFALGAFFALFLLGLGIGEGQLRLFMFFIAAGGFALWEAGPGDLIRSGETLAAAFLKQSAQKHTASRKKEPTDSKKVTYFCKKLFPSPARWFTIFKSRKDPAAEGTPPCRGEGSALGRGDSHEV